MILPHVASRYLDQAQPGGAFHGLEPVSPETVAKVASEHRNISVGYLAFIAQIGIGSCETLNIYLPHPVEDLVDHQSYKLYRTRSHLSLFPRRPVERFPLGAVCIADCGASWRYCFGPNLGTQIYTFDLADGVLAPTHASFEMLIDEGLPSAQLASS